MTESSEKGVRERSWKLEGPEGVIERAPL